MNFKILICGLPGSGKTTLAKALIETFQEKVTWFNADAVRTQFNDWDFSEEGRKRQALRMNELCSGEGIFIADFVAPTKELRSLFNADFIIFMNTIKEGRFEDTNKIFESPENVNLEINDFDYDQIQIKNKIIKLIIERLTLIYNNFLLNKEKELKIIKENFNNEMNKNSIKLKTAKVSKRNLDVRRKIFEKQNHSKIDSDDSEEIAEFLFNFLINNINENKSNSVLYYDGIYNSAKTEILEYYKLHLKNKNELKTFNENKLKELKIISQNAKKYGISLNIIKLVKNFF